MHSFISHHILQPSFSDYRYFRNYIFFFFEERPFLPNLTLFFVTLPSHMHGSGVASTLA